MRKPSGKSRGATAKRNAQSRVKGGLPTVPAEKVIESKSRTIFIDAVAPWLVTDWTQHDYGIDAIVELTRETDIAGNLDATGKRFAVQLKATMGELPSQPSSPHVRVRPEHIRYWIESTEPVLLVLCHVPTRRLYWRWVDHYVVDELNRRDPAWIGQTSVTVTLAQSHVLDEAARTEIATFVTGFRRSAQRVLAPGRYIELHTQLSALATELRSRAHEVGFQSVTRRLVDLEASVRSSTYVIALTGPARAGKSTLLNALVGREISPVGRLPTTAVSLLVMAGSRDEAEVLLEGDERVRGDATAVFLEQFATQERNPDNRKGVRMVTVRLVNELLERGIAYADAPGLHDPSDVIRAVTETALKAAHAVLYILDIAPAKNGGFSLNAHQLADLKRLRGMAERLFIVLNKSDVLSGEERDEVSGYVRATLEKYDLWAALPAPPLLLSAAASWLWQQGGRVGQSPLSELEDAIWNHLLQTNSTGLDRLRAGAIELQRSGREFVALLAARRLSGREAHRLRAALDTCRITERNLVIRCRNQRSLDEQYVTQRLEEQREVLLGRLRKVLEAVSVEEELPTSFQLEQALQSHVLKALTDLWREASTRIQAFAALLSNDVEKSLQQARLATGAGEPVTFRVPQLPALNIDLDSFEEAWTGLLTGGLFGLILGGPWAWALAAGGWLAGALLGRERRRMRKVMRVMSRARSSLDGAFGTVRAQIFGKIGIFLGALERHVTDRVSVFVHDVEGQLKKCGIPLAPAEAARLEEHERAVGATLAALEDASRDLLL